MSSKTYFYFKGEIKFYTFIIFVENINLSIYLSEEKKKLFLNKIKFLTKQINFLSIDLKIYILCFY